MGEVPEIPRMLLEAAREDAKAVAVLIAQAGIADSIVGFHAQQSVEKALKAVLAFNDVAFRRTHDLAELLDLIEDQGLVAPPHADTLDELNPFAVEARYGLIGPGGLAREGLLELIESVLLWAQQEIFTRGR